MLLQAWERKALEEDLEAQDVDAKLLDEGEVNEKVGLVDPARRDILVDMDVDFDEEGEKRDEEISKCMRLYTSLSRWQMLLLPHRTPYLWSIPVAQEETTHESSFDP